MIDLQKSNRPASARDTLVVLDNVARLRDLDLDRNDRHHLNEQLKHDGQLAQCEVSGRMILVHLTDRSDRTKQLEKARRAGNEMAVRLNGATTEAEMYAQREILLWITG